MKTHARVRRATSITPGSVVKARVFFPTPRSAHFVIYVVDKGICTSLGRVFHGLGLAKLSVLCSSGDLLGTMGTFLLLMLLICGGETSSVPSPWGLL